MDKLIKCRSRLMRGNVGIASMLLPLSFVESDCETMATDGKSIFYSPKFVNDHTDEEIEGVLIHEACHVIWEHPLRKGNRNHKLWNVACDYAINNYLLYDLKMELPEGGVWDEKYHKMSAEQVYHILDTDDDALEKAKKQMQGNADAEDQQDGDSDSVGSQEESLTGKYSSDQAGTSVSKYDDIPTSIGEVIEPTDDDGKPLSKNALEELANSIRKQIILGDKLVNMSEGQTNALSGRVEQMRTASVDWKNQLRDCLESVMAKDYSWSRLNRRHQWRGVNLPSKVKSSDGGEIAIAIDTSCSVSQAELDYMASETQLMLEECGIDKIRVCYCDHTVRINPNTDEWWDTFDISMGDEIEFKFRGGGWTRFEPVFNLLEDYTDDDQDIKALIYFTDGYCRIESKYEPSIPVFWGLTTRWSDELEGLEDRFRKDIPFGEFVGVDCSKAHN